ncbi:hypothetical protein Stsp01_08670 [Streptomyces sp. NBRC 13847]|uniref:hypothetical protein n=1 Tax=Streptomyces TaxID=1883 RepID=UPI0024A1C18A|nr:hypothetical protein [Streptomyces sp. NBRC 13847]GLW14124.1 hypothetical protein Stsp01_08670 [Streptomyces sp. NBRC 13847]
MRTLPFLRRANGVRTEPLSLTAAAPAPGASRSDASATPPAPSRHPASTLPVVPDHPAAGNRPVLVPYDLSFSNNLDYGRSSDAAGPWCGAVARRPAAPRTAPGRDGRRGRFRLRAARAAVPVPGTGGRFAPAAAAVGGGRAPIPSPGREAAASVAAIAPMSLLPRVGYVPGGAGGRSLVAGAGRVPRAVGHDADRRRPRQIPRTPRCPVPGRGH